MEIFSSSPFNRTSKRNNRKRPVGYNATFDGRRKSVKTVTLGTSPKRSWRIRSVAKLKFKLILSSPMKLWRKLKNGDMNLNSSSSANGLGEKRVPKARQSSRVSSSNTEFDNRLVFEIYKSLVTSHELATN
ncbi:hypothetical protein ACET3Z_010910 [Daucus carota]